MALPAVLRAGDLPGWMSEAEAARDHGARMLSQGVPARAAAALGARDEAACGDDEGGGVLGRMAGHLGQHRGIGVGGQDDAGVAEHVLDDFQVGAGSEREAGGAVSQVMQPDRRQAASQSSWRKYRDSRSGAMGSPLRPVTT